jgi:hypothetical protein
VAKHLNASEGNVTRAQPRLAEGQDLTLLMSQSDTNHSRGLIDVEFTIERGANV